eukprot:11197033-Lingulodinium_polyedra.AAC.1
MVVNTALPGTSVNRPGPMPRVTTAVMTVAWDPPAAEANNAPGSGAETTATSDGAGLETPSLPHLRNA